MRDTSPLRAVAVWPARLLRLVEDFAFREHDLRILARGWRLRRDRPFSRVFRDGRWDDVTACPRCGWAVFAGESCCGDEAGSDGSEDDTRLVAALPEVLR